MVDFGSTRVPFELRDAKSDLVPLGAAFSLSMPVTLRAVCATFPAALEMVSFTDSAAALIFEVDSSSGTETEGAVSVCSPSLDSDCSAAFSA